MARDVSATLVYFKQIKKSGSWSVLRNAYLLLQMIAFTSELSVVVLSTSAVAKLQLAATSHSATTLTELLIRELEYEYVGVRCDFNTGIFAFILAAALRVRFGLRKAKQLSWVGVRQPVS